MARPRVITAVGTIIGNTLQCPNNRQVDQYLGIPYAEAPVGPLRFHDPKPLLHLPKEPFEAVHYGLSCPQQLDLTFGDFSGSCMWNPTDEQSEDCLYLNIWAPTGLRDKLPVMVWIYGGGFYNGTSNLDLYNGTFLAGHRKVIIVSFNYRTSVLGFFSTGDGRYKGNYGLKDQITALKWVKKNICSFGGDVDNITVFGESAGSSSIALHLMSTYFYKGLFHKAIFQSGSPKSCWSFMSQNIAQKRCKEFLTNLGYSENNNDDLGKFLEEVDVGDLVKNDWVDCGLMRFPWVPTVDGDFLLDEPVNLLQQGEFHTVDCIVGCNLNEGSVWCTYYLPEHFTISDPSCLQNKETFDKCVDIINQDLSSETRDKIKEFYTCHDIINTDDRTAIRTAIGNVIGDRGFVFPCIELLQLMTSNGATGYLYYLKYRASTEVWPEWTGVIHGAEIQWMFGVPLREHSIFKEAEKNLSRNFMDCVANFAKYGNPSGNAIQWPVYTADQQNYLSINSPESYITEKALRTKYCQFWKEIFHGTKLNN